MYVNIVSFDVHCFSLIVKCTCDGFTLRKGALRQQYHYHFPGLGLTSERRFQGPKIIIICHSILRSTSERAL